MPLARQNGKLLRVDGRLAVSCCICDDDGPRCVHVCCSSIGLFQGVNCQRDGVYLHTVTIPSRYSLPVPINIRGFVDDDLLLNAQSITKDLGLDPGPYPNTVGAACVGAHAIGSQPGPYMDTKNGGITFPMSQQTFTVALRDTIGGGATMVVTICVDPNRTQRYRGNLQLEGSCSPGLACNPLP